MDRNEPAIAGMEPLTLETVLKVPSEGKQRGWPRNMPVRDADARRRLWRVVQLVANMEAHRRAVAARRLVAREFIEIARFGKREHLLGVI